MALGAANRTQIIIAAIGAVAAIAAAVIALVPSLMPAKPDPTEAPPAQTAAVPPQPEPKKLVAIPIIGTSAEFQVFQENFQSTQPGWPFDRNNYLKDGRLHIDYDEINGEVHPFLNGYYQIGRGAFAMSARVKYESGPPGTYGIVLRAIGSQTFLFVEVNKAGQVRLSKYADKTWDDLTPWTALPAGSENARLGVSNQFLAPTLPNTDHMANLTDGTTGPMDTLYVYADKVKIGEVPNFLKGNGLQFGVYSTLNVHASFDDIEVFDISSETGDLLKGSCQVFAGEEHCPGSP